MTQFCYLKDRTIISIKGDDAFTFLQSMITNDLSMLDNHLAIYTLFLSPTGRFLYDAFIVKNTDSYILDVDALHVSKFLQRLGFFKLKSKIEIEDKSEFFEIIYSKEQFELNVNYKDPRYSKLGYRYIVPKNSNFNREIAEDLYLKDKYEFCIPDGFVDYIQDKTLPPEYHFDKLSAVSYTKGCYTGQEVISRAKYQGVVRKKLYKLVFSQEVLDLSGQEVMQNGVKIGFITSSWKDHAIALLRIESLDTSSDIEVEKLIAKVFEAPWL